MPGSNKQSGYQKGTFIAIYAIGLSIFLAAVKAIAGLYSGSAAMLADAAESLSDCISSTAVLIGMRVASRPPDKEHPYGHGRAETISGKAVSILMIVFAVLLIGNSVKALVYHGQEEVDHKKMAWALAVGVFTILINELTFRFQRLMGRKINSSAILADAWHRRSDALSTIVAVIGIGCTLWGGPRWAFMDHAAAIGVAGIILWVGITSFRRTWAELMDTMASPDKVAMIRWVAEAVEGVKGVETINTRKSGLDLLVDIHAEVDPQMTVKEGHAIASRVRDKILEEVPNVRQVLVHVEPYYPGDH